MLCSHRKEVLCREDHFKYINLSVLLQQLAYRERKRFVFSAAATWLDDIFQGQATRSRLARPQIPTMATHA